MAVTGTGTQLDPYICYSWEDFESLGYFFNVDHLHTNNYTIVKQSSGLDPEPQLQPNIYIKFADLKDTEDEQSVGVDSKEVDFNNQCLPHSLLYNNIAQIDFNGWIFRNIATSYWHRELDKVDDEWESTTTCIGNTIIIRNMISGEIEGEPVNPLSYVKLLNGTFLFNEDWNYIYSLDVNEPTHREINNSDFYAIYDELDLLDEELTNYSQGGIGFNLFIRCFPLFFVDTYPKFFRLFLDRCDFTTYQSGWTNLISQYGQEITTYSDQYSFIQHSFNYRSNGQGSYSVYPASAIDIPGAALFVYCNINFYNDCGIPTWSTDSNMHFLNCNIHLFGSATATDLSQRNNLNAFKIIDLIKYWHSCAFDYCNVDIIINLPRNEWLNNIKMFAPIYNSSLNINCPNTDTFIFTGSNSSNNIYYSGVFTHAYPMQFMAEDETIQNARKIIDITGVRVEDYDELKDNPDYVLQNNNIADDLYRLLPTNDGSSITSEYSYVELIQKFRYNKYVHNGLPFVPLCQYPKIEGYDINRFINALYNGIVHRQVMFDGVNIMSMWTENNYNNIHWQREYVPILQSQLYGNWFNDTSQWDNQRKTIETDYVYVDDVHNVQYTVSSYSLKELQWYDEMSQETLTYYRPNPLITFDIVTFQDNNWYPLESYKHEAENLTGIEMSSDVSDMNKCIWFTINQTTLNRFNWCIVISSMLAQSYNSDNYLFYLPLHDELGETYVYYIKQSTYVSSNTVKNCYITNITNNPLPDKDFAVIQANPHLYEGCHIFAINCYGILLELFVDGEFYSNVNITNYLKGGNPISEDAFIGCCTPFKRERIPDSTDYDISNNFNGAILGLHVFADYCSWEDIWNIYTSYGQKFFVKELIPDFEPKLLYIITADVPTSMEIDTSTPISYDNFIIYGQYTNGTYEIHDKLNYSIPEGTIISQTGSQTIVITSNELLEWRCEVMLTVVENYNIRITLLDNTFAPTDTIYTCDTTTEAKTYLTDNQHLNNRYKVEIGANYSESTISGLNNCSTIYSVYLPDKTLTIDNAAFANCSNLKIVQFGDSAITLELDSFANCGFESITIPANVNLGSKCFESNTLLESVIINTTTINGFEGCTNLSDVTIVNDVSSVSSRAFFGCTALTNIDLSLVSGTIYANSFKNCTALETVTLSTNLHYVQSNAFDNTKLLNDFNNSVDNYLIVNNYLLATKPVTNSIITIPNTITGIAENSIIVGTDNFNCTTLTLPTSLKYLSANAITLTANTSLNTLNIPSLIDVEGKWITYNTNSEINNINIGSGVVCVGNTWETNNFTSNICCTTITVDNNNSTYNIQSNAIYSKDNTILFRFVNADNMDNSIPSGTVYISGKALELLNNTNSLFIPSTVEGLNSTGNVVNITNVTIDDSYENAPDIASVFNREYCECTYTKNVTMRTINASTLKPTGSTVEYFTNTTDACNALKTASSSYWYSINVGSKIDPDTVTTFDNCTRLKKCIIKSSVVSLSSTFSGCTALTNAELPNTLKTIIGVFNNCTSLVNLTLPEGLETIGSSTFYKCSAITTLNIPTTVTTIAQGAFNESKFVKNINTAVIVDKWLISWKNASGAITIDSSVLGIADGVFNSNRNITSANLNNVIHINLNSNSSPFNSCTALNNFSVSANNSVMTTTDGIIYSKDYTNLIKCPMAKTGNITVDSRCTTIKAYAFYYVANTGYTIDLSNVVNFETACMNNVKSTLVINKTVKHIADSCFYNCTNLTSINLDDDIETIPNSAFVNNGLTTIALPNNLITIGASNFKGCNISEVTIPNGVTEIQSSAFSNCANLLTVTIPNTVTTFGPNVFDTTPYLDDLVLQNPLVIINNCAITGKTCTGAIIIPNNTTQITGSCFKGASSMTAITIPNSVNSIGSNAFEGCSSLTSINIPGSVKKWPSQLFKDCTSLATITLNEGLEEIGVQPFNNVTTSGHSPIITEITIPSTVHNIATAAFDSRYIPSLQTIYVNNVEGCYPDTVFLYCTATVVYMQN